VSPARLAARCLELLGPLGGPVVVVAPADGRVAAALRRGVSGAHDGARPAGAVVVFLGTRARPAERQSTLRDLGRVLPPGAPLLLVDHNQPRAWWRRAVAVPHHLVARVGAARARYPAARELAAVGFTVERLRLACGERVQLVVARATTVP
jgi:hypothetical protein